MTGPRTRLPTWSRRRRRRTLCALRRVATFRPEELDRQRRHPAQSGPDLRLRPTARVPGRTRHHHQAGIAHLMPVLLRTAGFALALGLVWLAAGRLRRVGAGSRVPAHGSTSISPVPGRRKGTWRHNERRGRAAASRGGASGRLALDAARRVWVGGPSEETYDSGPSRACRDMEAARPVAPGAGPGGRSSTSIARGVPARVITGRDRTEGWRDLPRSRFWRVGTRPAVRPT